MKTWMKVLLGIFVGIIGLVGFVFWLTGDITKTGDEFFAAIQNDDIDAAYALLSDDFRAGVTKEGLKAYLAANALDKVKETSWSGRSMSGGMGSLQGTVTTESGSQIPLKLRLVDSEAGWQINSIEKESAGFRGSDAGNPLPSVKKQQQLFTNTVTLFAASLADKSMKKLVDNSSSNLREQISVAKFDQTFMEFYDDADEFVNIARMGPVMDDASINGETGILTLKGHHALNPQPIFWELEYIYEGIDWKLLGIAFQVGSLPV